LPKLLKIVVLLWGKAFTVSLFSELRRRNVHRIAAAYSVAAWLIVQVVETVFPAFGFDDSTTRLTVIILIIGFVPAVVLAWVFELTPEGIRRERPAATGSQADPIARRRLDRAIMVVLAVAVAYFAIDKFLTVETRGPSSPATNDSTTYEVTDTVAARSIAVLPFADMSPASDHEFFADGIAEELLNLLSRVPELRVVYRSSSFAFKQKDMTGCERMQTRFASPPSLSMREQTPICGAIPTRDRFAMSSRSRTTLRPR
jgi:hypothetical protein